MYWSAIIVHFTKVHDTMQLWQCWKMCHENWDFSIKAILAQNKQLKELIILYTLEIVKQRIFDKKEQEIFDRNVENSRKCLSINPMNNHKM